MPNYLHKRRKKKRKKERDKRHNNQTTDSVGKREKHLTQDTGWIVFEQKVSIDHEDYEQNDVDDHDHDFGHRTSSG